MTIKDEMSMNEQKQVMPIDREAVIRELTQHQSWFLCNVK